MLLTLTQPVTDCCGQDWCGEVPPPPPSGGGGAFHHPYTEKPAPNRRKKKEDDLWVILMHQNLVDRRQRGR